MANPPSNHENNNKKMKNNTKSIKLNIGGMGVGGIVLLGGGLVAAALVSALAIKTRRRSSNGINNENSVNESNQDFGLQNSSDEATGMKLKEMQPKPNRILTPDENQNSGVDSGDDGIVGEDQESSLIFIDSVSEVENGYQRIITFDCEQQLDVASQTESGFPSITASRDGGGGGGENDSDTDVAGTEKSLDSIEAMEEYEAVEVEEIPNVVEDQETVFMSEEAAALEKKDKDETIPENCEEDLIDETGYPDSVVNELEMIEEAKIEVEEDNPQVQILEEEKEIDGHDEIVVEDCEGDSSYKTGEIMKGEKQQMENNNSERVKGEEEEEAIKAACVETVNMEEMPLNQVCETITSGEHPSFAVDGAAVTEGKETAQEVEQVTGKDEFVNEQEKEKDKEGEMPRAQLIEVDDQPVVRDDNPPRQLMTTEAELVEKVRISNEDERSTEESKNGEEDASEVSSDGTRYSSMQDEVIPEAKISNHKTEENMTIAGADQNDRDQNRIIEEDNSAPNYIERLTKQAAVSQPWNLKLWTWSLLASIWCICHCYSELPFPELSLVGSLLFVFILLGYRKRNTKYSVKYE